MIRVSVTRPTLADARREMLAEVRAVEAAGHQLVGFSAEKLEGAVRIRAQLIREDRA